MNKYKLSTQIMDEFEFFPSTKQLATLMALTINFLTNESDISILEPQAGSGVLVNSLKTIGYKDIDCIEILPELREILVNDGHNLIHDNFLTFNTNKNYDFIVMNPPFKTAELHVMKAIEILEQSGGVLITQVSKNFMKPWDNCKQVHEKLRNHNAFYIKQGAPYSTNAERTTDVEVILLIAKIGENKKSLNALHFLRDVQKF